MYSISKFYFLFHENEKKNQSFFYFFLSSKLRLNTFRNLFSFLHFLVFETLWIPPSVDELSEAEETDSYSSTLTSSMIAAVVEEEVGMDGGIGLFVEEVSVGGGEDFMRASAASKSLEEDAVTNSKESSVFLNLAKPLPDLIAFLQDAILDAAAEKAAKQPLHFSYSFPLVKLKTKRMEIKVTAIMVMMMVQTMKTVSLPFEEGGDVVVVVGIGGGVETNHRVFISFRPLSFCEESEEEEESTCELGEREEEEEERGMSVVGIGVVKLNQVG